MFHQQTFDHAGFGPARGIDADLDLLRGPVKHAAGSFTKPGFHDDEPCALAATDRGLRVRRRHWRQLERILQLLEKDARTVGVVLVDDGDPDLALLSVVLAAEHDAEQHRYQDRPDESEEHAAAIA